MSGEPRLTGSLLYIVTLPVPTKNVERLSALVVLVMLTAVGIYVRLAGLAEWHFSGDEIWHLEHAREQTVAAVVGRAYAKDAHPPLLYILLHFLTQLSLDTMWLRLVALLPGCLLIPAAFLLGRELGKGVPAGLTAALLVATGFELIVQSQILRQYSLLLLLLMVLLWAWLMVMQRGSRVHLGLYFAVGFLAMGCHYSAAIALAALGLVGLFFPRFSMPLPRRWVWIGGHLALATFLGLQARSYLASRGTLFPDEFQYMMRWMAEGPTGIIGPLAHLQHLFFPWDAGLAGLLWIVVAMGFWALVRHRRWDLIVLTVAPIALHVVLTLAGLYPFAVYRWTLYLVPFMLVPIAFAVRLADELLARRGAWIMFLAIAACVALSYRQSRVDLADPDSFRLSTADFSYKFADGRTAKAFLAKVAHKGDVLLSTDSGRRRQLYEHWIEVASGQTPPDLTSPLRKEECPGIYFVQPWRTRNCVRPFLRDHQEFDRSGRVWMMVPRLQGDFWRPGAATQPPPDAFVALETPTLLVLAADTLSQSR